MALGYQNPYYLNKAKRAQPTLYDGHGNLKTNHVLAIVPTLEEDLELADISREKMIEKLKDPEYVKWNITHKTFNYSKENFIVTFTPHTTLTPKQVFWSKDLVKGRAEALKAQAIPLKVLPPAIVSLVKEVRAMKAVFENMEAESYAVKLEAENSKLLEKIQNDNHYSMVKHFSKLEIDHLNLQLKYQHLKENIGNSKSKTSKDAPEFDAFFELNKRNDQLQAHRNTIKIIVTFTPQTTLTPEQVFWSKDLVKGRAEALKAQAIPLKVLPPAIVSLVKEVRAMKAVFENMEAEEVFYTVTDSILTASRFHELNVTYDV
nr:hypothetical protein [Tanacetum cinerariifolium]